jgi:hypothetical protein
MTQNPIAAILDIVPIKARLTILGRQYDYIPASAGYCEGIYRADAGHGQGNPCFTLRSASAPEALGVYLAGGHGVKRAVAMAVIEAARLEFSGVSS